MTADTRPDPDRVAGQEPAVRLVVLGDAAGAPVCDGDVCYLPPPAADEPTPRLEPGEGDGPQ